jgi:hypothetical protein
VESISHRTRDLAKRPGSDGGGRVRGVEGGWTNRSRR